jgi:hypothetical protein
MTVTSSGEIMVGNLGEQLDLAVNPIALFILILIWCDVSEPVESHDHKGAQRTNLPLISDC